MLEFITQYWEMILAGIGVISTPIGYFLGGKQAKRIEIKKSNADAVSAMQSVYDQFLEDYKSRMAEVMAELTSVKDTNTILQQQFNEIHLQYAKEVEKSQNWEKLHRELNQKYIELEKDHDKLKMLYEKLKADFEKYKRKI